MIDRFNLKPLIDDINQVLFSTLTRVNLGNSRLARSVKIELDGNSFKIKFSEYVHFVDSGRRPNSKPPPIKPIIDFIRRKGITPINITELQLAYAISKSIGKRGIKSRPFLDRLSDEVHELIQLHISKEIEKILKESLN